MSDPLKLTCPTADRPSPSMWRPASSPSARRPQSTGRRSTSTPASRRWRPRSQRAADGWPRRCGKEQSKGRLLEDRFRKLVDDAKKAGDGRQADPGHRSRLEDPTIWRLGSGVPYPSPARASLRARFRFRFRARARARWVTQRTRRSRLSVTKKRRGSPAPLIRCAGPTFDQPPSRPWRGRRHGRPWRLSSLSITRVNSSTGMAPRMAMPLIRKPGVPVMPKPARLAHVLIDPRPKVLLSRHAVNVSAFRPSAVASASARRGRSCPCSPNSQSCISRTCPARSRTTTPRRRAAPGVHRQRQLLEPRAGPSRRSAPRSG